MSSSSVEMSTLVPAFMPYGKSTRYLVRTEPGRRDAVMKDVEQKLAEANHGRIVGRLRTIETVRAEAYAGDRAMAVILGGVIVALLLITALGIVGMASFWVAQRKADRHAPRLGATRRHPALLHDRELRHHHTGLAAGALLTLRLQLLADHPHQGAAPAAGLPRRRVLALWLLGQIAVFGLATRASRVPPAVATRSV